MRSVFLVLSVLFSAFFIVSCATTTEIITTAEVITKEIMVSNTKGYKVDVAGEDTIDLKTRPGWVDDFEKWREEKEKSGDVTYFLGASNPSFNDLEEQKKNWMFEDAAEAVYQDALRQVAGYVGSQIISVYQESLKTIQAEKLIEFKGKTETEWKKEEDEMKFYLENSSNSSFYLSGLRPDNRFREEWEKQTPQGKIHAVRYWVIYSVSQEDVDEARNKIESDRLVSDENTREKNRKESDNNKLKDLKNKYNIAINELNGIDFVKTPDKYTDKYYELSDISSKLKNDSEFPTFETRNDQPVLGYRKFMNDISADLTEKNPHDTQRRLVENLQKQLADKEKEIIDKEGIIKGFGLKDSASTQNIATRSETLIVSYPPRPLETLITGANIFAANNMVQNRDFISFLNINGISAFGRDEHGLDAPAVLLTWNDAARYCNWLSRLYGYTPYYSEAKGQITGYNKKNNGYRLPEHSELVVILDTAPDIVDEAEFTRIAVWSQEGDAQAHKSYRLKAVKGSSASRLSEQVAGNSITAMTIGFRLVRNEQ